MIKPDAIMMYLDARGHFGEVFRASDHGIVFVQDSVSYSRKAGTLRGLHTQVGVDAQTQLLTILTGKVLDVIVTFDKNGFHVNANVLEHLKANQVLIPPRTLHGFVTLTDEVVMLYKSDRYFHPGIDVKINPFDRRLSIAWGISSKDAVMSESDRHAMAYDEFVSLTQSHC
jgi:dTDP-4-dehydrorhamnose 3,5-epimerase